MLPVSSVSLAAAGSEAGAAFPLTFDPGFKCNSRAFGGLSPSGKDKMANLVVGDSEHHGAWVPATRWDLEEVT